MCLTSIIRQSCWWFWGFCWCWWWQAFFSKDFSPKELHKLKEFQSQTYTKLKLVKVCLGELCNRYVTKPSHNWKSQVSRGLSPPSLTPTNPQSRCRRARGCDQGLLPPRLPAHQGLHRLPPAFPETAPVCHKSTQACVQVPSHTKVAMPGLIHNLIVSAFHEYLISWKISRCHKTFLKHFWIICLQLPERPDGQWGNLHSHNQAMSLSRQVIRSLEIPFLDRSSHWSNLYCVWRKI